MKNETSKSVTYKAGITIAWIWDLMQFIAVVTVLASCAMLIYKVLQ